MSFLKKIRHFFSAQFFDKVFIFRFTLIHYFFMISFWIFFFTVRWMRSVFKYNPYGINIFLWQWLTANVIKDISIVMIWFFFFNFIYVIVMFLLKESQSDWFVFDEKIKSVEEIPSDVLNTWLYKYVFFYMVNLNVLLIFLCIVFTNYFFEYKHTIPLFWSISFIFLCVLIFVIFWLNYFYCYYKFKKYVLFDKIFK